MLYIRTDMNDTIATGHVMRCISIAEAAVQLGGEVLFIVSDHQSDELLNKYGFTSIVLESDYIILEQGIDKVLETLSENDVLLIDTYSRTTEFLTALRGRAFTVYIDDMGKEVFNVDCIICYAPYYKMFDYEIRYKYSNTSFLTGTKYAPLRKEFKNCIQKQIRKKIKKILIVSGGTDVYNIIPKFIDTLLYIDRHEKQYTITAICGMFCNYYHEIREKYDFLDVNVNVISSTPNIIDYFIESDLVISASGSTLYEICATGTPAISYSISEDQIYNATTFSELGVIPYLGDIGQGNVIYDNLLPCIIDLASEIKRKKISSKMKRIVDGYGTQRIIKEINKLTRGGIYE